MEAFVICCMPSRHALNGLGIAGNTYSRPTRLLDGVRPRVEHLKGGSETLSVIWPDILHQSVVTVPIYDNDGKTHWSVPSNNNLDDILNPNNSGLLYVFGESCDVNELALHNEQKTSYKYFRSMEPKDTPSGLWESLAGTPRIKRRLFLTTPFVRDALPISLSVTPGIKEQKESFAAILNPMIIRVKLAGNDLAEPDGRINLQKTLNDELAACQQPGGFMMVEPLIPAADEERIRALREGARMLKGVEKTRLSRVLSLIWGSDERVLDEPWLPFYCLDSLNGTFMICGCQEPHKTVHGMMEKKWYRNTGTASANSRWFARYWAKLWGGTHEDDSPSFNIIHRHPEAIRRESFRTPDDYTGLFLLSAAEKLDHRPGKLFDELADTPASYNKALYGFLAHIFQHTTAPFHQPYMRWIVHDNGSKELRVDNMSLLEMAGRKALLPKSALRAQFPALSSLPRGEARELYRDAIGERCLDLYQSVDWAGRRFGELLFTALQQGGAPEIASQDTETVWNVPYRDNWWGVWYQGLFTQRPPKPVRFMSSFVLGVSKLGVDMIGGHGGSKGNYRPTPNMRF